VHEHVAFSPEGWESIAVGERGLASDAHGILPRMAQTLTQLCVHLVFSTKGRTPWLDDALEAELVASMGGIARNLKSPLVAAGIADDHVHLLLCQAKTITLADLAMHIKKDSSKWVKSKRADLRRFGWQDGYAGFGFSPPALPALKRYLAGQRQHHRRFDFKAELRKLCKQYDVEIDERYAWS
jgi:REP element-mobilizing transposase RayT